MWPSEKRLHYLMSTYRGIQSSDWDVNWDRVMGPSKWTKVKDHVKNTKAKLVQESFKSLIFQKFGDLKSQYSTVGINDIFEFNTFKYIKSIKKLTDDEDSQNGFICDLTYARHNIEGHAILKCSQRRRADNLVYEYWAGLFVNNLVKKYPCFLETYGLFQFKNERSWRYISSTPKGDNIQNMGEFELVCQPPKNCNVDDLCVRAKHYSVLIQYIEQPTGYGEFLKTILQESFHKRLSGQDKFDLMTTLHTVYYTLSSLQPEFTHYDLHQNNVVIYKPFGDQKQIRYIYHLKDGTSLTYCSEYMTKILDYGRAYFAGNGRYIKFVRSHPNCNSGKEEYGDDSGFEFHTFPTCDGAGYWICPSQPSASHDLRLLKHVQGILQDMKNSPLDRQIKYDHMFGTPSIKSSTDGQITSVTHAHDFLAQWLKKNPFRSKKEVVATMIIEHDKNIKFLNYDVTKAEKQTEDQVGILSTLISPN